MTLHCQKPVGRRLGISWPICGLENMSNLYLELGHNAIKTEKPRWNYLTQILHNAAMKNCLDLFQ